MKYDERASSSGKPKIAKKLAARPALPVGRLADAGGAKLVFFGNERLASGLPPIEPVVLKSLVEEGYDVVVVVANHSQGRTRHPRPLEIADAAKSYGIPLFLPQKTIDIKDELATFGAEAAVLVAYGRIVSKSIIDLFPGGIVNIHPSLLPKYRGPTPIEQAILDGTPETGVSLMKLTPAVDAGPVFAQQAMKLRGDESKIELADSLLRLGASLLTQHLPTILDGMLSPLPQKEKEATYTKLLKKADGWISFREPAEIIERKVRAYFGYPKARAEISGHEIVITKSRTAKDADDGDLVIKCQPGWLEIQKLTAPSGRTMSGADFLRGYQAKNQS